jgi:hypothetical protein
MSPEKSALSRALISGNFPFWDSLWLQPQRDFKADILHLFFFQNIYGKLSAA